jgi:hypothetical protein
MDPSEEKMADLGCTKVNPLLQGGISRSHFPKKTGMMNKAAMASNSAGSLKGADFAV